MPNVLALESDHVRFAALVFKGDPISGGGPVRKFGGDSLRMATGLSVLPIFAIASDVADPFTTRNTICRRSETRPTVFSIVAGIVKRLRRARRTKT